MSTTQKTITVTEQQNEWIKAQIATGKYTNDSDYVQDLIRKDQDRNSHDQALRAALIKGEQSAEVMSFDGDLFISEMAARHADKLA